MLDGETSKKSKTVRAHFRSYTAVIGELVWASNYSHLAFEILFSHVATPADYQVGRSIWHSSPSDSGQLQMLGVAAEISERLSKDKKMRDKILWAVDQGKKLGVSRNDAVHSLTFITRGKPAKVAISEVGTKPTRYRKLESNADLKKHYRRVKDDLWKLGRYVHALWPLVAGFPAHDPLPRKPLLVSIPKSDRKKLRPHPK